MIVTIFDDFPTIDFNSVGNITFNFCDKSETAEDAQYIAKQFDCLIKTALEQNKTVILTKEDLK